MVRLRGVLHDHVQDLVEQVKQQLSGDESDAEEKAEEDERYGTFRIESISPNLVVIPDTDNIEEMDVRYPLIEPFADAHIYWDDDEETLVYDIDEPDLTEREEMIFSDLREALEEKLDVPMSRLETTEDIIDYLERKMDEVLTELGYRLRDEERNKVMYYVYRNFAGLNEIEPMMHDPYIEDVGCSGIGIPVYIVHSKFGSIRTTMAFDDEDELKNLVVKLAERANKYVSYAEPLLDGTLPDGSRVNASLTQDVTTKGPTFSIRKFQEVPMSAVDLIDLGTTTSDIMAYMWLALEYQRSLLVIGGTATGKTTFLNAAVTFIPPEQKIVSIEDTRELQLPHENWIPSVTRSGFGMESEQTDITMYQLLRESFRQNPDYVIVGEVRGDEASVLFQGMASGHPSISTMHASSPTDVVSRLTTPPINLSPALVKTMDFIVSMTHAQEIGKNARRVESIFEIEDITEEGSPRTNEWASWIPIDDTFSFKEESTVLERIQRQYGISAKEIQQEFEDRKAVLEWMLDNGYTHFSEVAKIVHEYYSDKEQVMTAMAEDSTLQMEQVIESGGSSGTQLPSEVIEEQQELAASMSAEEEERVESDLFGGVEDVGRNPFQRRLPRPTIEEEEQTTTQSVADSTGRSSERSFEEQEADDDAELERDGAPREPGETSETGEQERASMTDEELAERVEEELLDETEMEEHELFGDHEDVDEDPFEGEEAGERDNEDKKRAQDGGDG